MTRLSAILLAALSCEAEPARQLECPACVCTSLAPAPVCASPPECHMRPYDEGVAHGQRYSLDAIIFERCLSYAGFEPGWEEREKQCFLAWNRWDEGFPPGLKDEVR